MASPSSSSVTVPVPGRCAQLYNQFSTSMKQGWSGRIVTGLAGAFTLAGPIMGAINGLERKNPAEFGADYTSKLLCRKGDHFSPINGVMQTYIKGAGKFILPALPLLTIAGGVLWRARSAASSGQSYAVRVYNEAKNVPWSRLAMAVATTGIAVLLAVTEKQWIPAVNEFSAANDFSPNLVSDAPSGHFYMSLAIGCATMFTQSAASVYNQPFVAVGSTALMGVLAWANATFLEHTAWVCHTTKEVYEGLAIGIGVPAALCLSVVLGRVGLWTGKQACKAVVWTTRTTFNAITNVFCCCCRSKGGNKKSRLGRVTTDSSIVVN